jgi:hypothetical protein
MNFIIVALLLTPLIINPSKKKKGTPYKCKNLIEVLSRNKIQIKHSYVTPDHVYSCSGRKDMQGQSLSGKKKNQFFKKNHIVEIPNHFFRKHSPWTFEYQFSFASIDSTGLKRNSEVYGQSLLLGYTNTLKKNVKYTFWFGLNQLAASGKTNSTSFKEVSTPAPVGQIRITFNLNPIWSYYTFLRVDRLSILGKNKNNQEVQTFTYKTDSGIGVEKLWGKKWISRFDGNFVLPSVNNNNNIVSGIGTGAEIEHSWRNWSLNYRASYLDLKKERGSDSSFAHLVKIGYQF